MSNQKSFSKYKYILGWLLGLTLIGLIGLAIIIAYYKNKGNPLDYETINQRKAKLSEVNAKQNEIMSSYSWIDQPKGIVRVPIQRAMTLTVDQLSKENILKNKEVSFSSRE